MSWDERDKLRAAKPVGSHVNEVPAEAVEVERVPMTLTVAAFASGPGAAWLQWAHRTYVERRLGPNAPDTALRFYEGQKQLILAIESEVREWRAALEARARAQ